VASIPKGRVKWLVAPPIRQARATERLLAEMRRLSGAARPVGTARAVPRPAAH
jgi:hypothetical protein